MRGSPAQRLESIATLRPVARAVVGDDDLLVDGADVDRAHALDDFADRLLLVVDGDDDREFHRYDAIR